MNPQTSPGRGEAPAAAVTELTVTNFVFRRSGRGGHLVTGLICLPRLRAWPPPCGHAEPDETPDRAARRETIEELGCRTRFLPPPGPPLPAGFPHQPAPAPWWVIEMNASADSHTPARHRHQDHIFVSHWLEDARPPETEANLAISGPGARDRPPAGRRAGRQHNRRRRTTRDCRGGDSPTRKGRAAVVRASSWLFP